jgi:uncharacterized coiled-coil protein SlyX
VVAHSQQQEASMSISVSEGLELDSLTANGSIEDTVTALVEIVEQQRETIDELTETVSDLRDDVDDLQETVDEQPEVEVEDDGDPLGSVTVDGAPLGRALKSKPSRTDVEDMIEDTTPTHDDGQTTIQESDTTPIERLAVADDVEEVTDSVSVERAVSLFRNLPKWGAKTPKGICLRPKDNPLELLEADRDESLAWKQYYRAAKVLERLSKGAVTFFDSDRHGKMIVLHEQSEIYERVVNSRLTPSSERAEV